MGINVHYIVTPNKTTAGENFEILRYFPNKIWKKILKIFLCEFSKKFKRKFEDILFTHNEAVEGEILKFFPNFLKKWKKILKIFF